VPNTFKAFAIDSIVDETRYGRKQFRYRSGCPKNTVLRLELEESEAVFMPRWRPVVLCCLIGKENLESTSGIGTALKGLRIPIWFRVVVKWRRIVSDVAAN